MPTDGTTLAGEHELDAPVSGTDTPRRPPFRTGHRFQEVAGRYSGLTVIALLILVFGLWVPGTFLTPTTFQGILGDQSITAILSLGLLFSFAAGQFDLSAASNLGLSALLCGELIVTLHWGWPMAALVAIAVGVVIGIVNGAVVTLGVNSFIATLGMSSVLEAITIAIGGGAYVGPMPPGFQAIASPVPLGVPVVAIYTIVLALIVWYVLEHSPAGRRFQATGANAAAARLAGVRTAQYRFWSLVLTGAIAALAGVLVAAKIGTVSPTVGAPYFLPAFAACLLGTTQIKLGRFNVWGTVVAILLLAVGVKGVQLISGQLWLTELFNGVALIGAVSVSVWTGHRKAKGGRGSRTTGLRFQ